MWGRASDRTLKAAEKHATGRIMSVHGPTAAEIVALVSLPAVMAESVELSITPEGLRGSCPSHPDPSRGLYVASTGRFYHCFSCGRHGDAVRWMMEREGIDEAAALRLLARRAAGDAQPGCG